MSIGVLMSGNLTPRLTPPGLGGLGGATAITATHIVDVTLSSLRSGLGNRVLTFPSQCFVR